MKRLSALEQRETIQLDRHHLGWPCFGGNLICGFAKSAPWRANTFLYLLESSVEPGTEEAATFAGGSKLAV